MNYTVSKNIKTLSYILIAIGILTTVVGFFTDHSEHHNRFWGNVFVNSFFFFAISLAATFFIAIQYAAEAAWGTVFKRVFEGVAGYLPLGALFLIIVFLAGSFHWHDMYQWMDPEVSNPNSHHFDKLIAGKSAYLNLPFFWIRTLLYLGVWTYCNHIFRKRSLEEDITGGTIIHFKNVKLAASFLVFFAVTSSTAAWDWIMSIDTHWYSTLFGWYVFSGMWVSGVITFILLTIYLKKQGHLTQINDSHIHDLGKWMFAISILWTYLWFSQFMLIWYSNIPEETTYFYERIRDYKFIFFGMAAINLIFPLLLMMARDTKRNIKYLLVVGCIIFIGHWIDVFVMVMPGTVGGEWTINIMEIGMFLGFLGMFIYKVFHTLSKAPLMVKNHPYLDESMHHHI